MISRRRLILAAGAATVFPSLAADSRKPGDVPRIGFLHTSANPNFIALREGLRAEGFQEGKNAAYEVRFYGSEPQRLADLAGDLVAKRCNVIFAAAPYAIQAVLSATGTIPIVGVDLESDPVAKGWLRSLSRPGANLTGMFLDTPELGGKQIQLQREALGGLANVGVLWDATIGETQFRATEAAARTAGLPLISLPICEVGEAKEAFARA